MNNSGRRSTLSFTISNKKLKQTYHHVISHPLLYKMNSNELCHMFQEKLFTDLTLTIKDDTNQLIMDVHKCILYLSSDYFKKMLTFNKNISNNATITVSNAHIAHDVIMSFYGQKTNNGNFPEWKHILELYMCRNFFCLENDPKILDNIMIPAEGFELLLSVIELIGYNENSMKIIANNLSQEYDLSEFPEQVMKRVQEIKKDIDTWYIFVADTSIKKWNPVTGDVEEFGKCYYGNYIQNICGSPDNKFVAGIYKRTSPDIGIWNATTGELVHIIDGEIYFTPKICYSPDNKYFITSHSSPDSWHVSYPYNQTYSLLKIWDSHTYELIHKWYVRKGKIEALCYSSDAKYIVTGHCKNVRIWDSYTHVLVCKFECDDARAICFSPNSKQLVCGSSSTSSIKIWDIETKTLINMLQGHSHNITKVCYSSNGKLIVSSSYDGTIKIWNSINGDLIQTIIASEKDRVDDLCFSPDGSKIISTSKEEVKIWDMNTYELVSTLNHKDSVLYICCLKWDNDMVKK